jgi:hypothetical protein
MKKNTVVPQLMSAEESMTWLDSKGFSYKLCDVPIPIMTGRVNCGAPLSIDDEMIEGYYYLPKSAVGLHPQVELCAQGESMIDADIHDGDLLRLELGAWPHDGDIVVAEIDGEYTAKVYFTDEDGRHWLCPMNKRFQPILLTESMNVRVSGVVRTIVKQVVRRSYGECQSIVKRMQEQRQQQDSLQERVRKAVADGSHLFWAASAWAVVYGVVRDCHGYEGSVIDFERKAIALDLPPTFDHCCSVGKVQRTISNHPYMRLHIDKWKENGASVREIVLMDFLRNNI